MDLREVIADLCCDRPTWSPGWLLVLIEGLPEGSHYWADRMGGPEYQGWTYDRFVRAATFDAIQISTVTTAKVAGAKGVKPPKPLPRPGDKTKKRQAGVPIRALIPRAIRKPPTLQRAESDGP